MACPEMSWMLALLGCGGSADPLPTAVVTPADFEVRLTAHGELEARVNTYVHTPNFPSSMTIGWLVEDGTRVKQGDRLLEFETTDLLARLDSAQSGLEAERMRITQRKARLVLEEAAALAEVERVAIGLHLAQLRVSESEVVSRVERESARVAVEVAQLGIAKAENALRALRAEAAAELELLQIQVEQKQRRLELAEGYLGQTTVYAPADGLVIGYGVRLGGVSWPTRRLYTLPDLGTMQVVAWVPEVDAPRVHVGQEATVVIDAYPEVPIPGTVSAVAELAVTGGSEWDWGEEGAVDDDVKRLRLVVQIRPPLPDASRAREPVLRPGMTVRADLLVDRRPAALTVPIQAVATDQDGPFVRVARPVGWARQPVRLGPENPLRVVIEDGVEAGQQVALADPDRWAAGERPVGHP